MLGVDLEELHMFRSLILKQILELCTACENLNCKSVAQEGQTSGFCENCYERLDSVTTRNLSTS